MASLYCSVNIRTLTNKYMNTVFIEVVEEVCFLSFVGGREHGFRVEYDFEYPRQLDRAPQLRVAVAKHLLDYHVHQHLILKLHKKYPI